MCIAELEGSTSLSISFDNITIIMEINNVPVQIHQEQNELTAVTVLKLENLNLYSATLYICEAYFKSTSNFLISSYFRTASIELHIQSKIR